MRLILCADDFGLSRAISETIAGLAADGKVNAITCMAACPGWETDSGMLRALPGHVEIGLHLVLTNERPLTAAPHLAPQGQFPTIRELARHTHLPHSEIAGEVEAQLDRFEQALGRPPAFLDGHQHSHALPHIRPIAVAAFARRNPRGWVRDCGDRAAAMLARPWRGKAFASAVRSSGLAAEARRRGLGTNRGFAGHYGFSGDYTRYFPAFLRSPGPRHLVMCHPGAGTLADDEIAEARRVEAAALRALPIGELAAERGLAFP